MRPLSEGRCYFLRLRDEVGCNKRGGKGSGGSWELVRGRRGPAKGGEGRRGAGGSAGLRKRDGFSSHTSNYCVTGD